MCYHIEDLINPELIRDFSESIKLSNAIRYISRKHKRLINLLFHPNPLAYKILYYRH